MLLHSTRSFWQEQWINLKFAISSTLLKNWSSNDLKFVRVVKHIYKINLLGLKGTFTCSSVLKK